MQIALLGLRDLAVAARGARRSVDPGRDGLEQRLGVREGVVVAADHQTVATLAAPHPPLVPQSIR